VGEGGEEGGAGWQEHRSKISFNVPEEKEGAAVMLRCGLHVRPRRHVRGVALGEGGTQRAKHTLHTFQNPAQFAALTKASIEHKQLHARAYQHAGRDHTDHDLEERTHFGGRGGGEVGKLRELWRRKRSWSFA
jgi:hypothetical protein